MKKKIAAVLLVGAMMFCNMGAVPALPEESTEISEETDTAAAFGDGEISFKDGAEVDFETESQQEQEEQLFSDEPIFGDTQELPRIEDAEIEFAQAGSGVIAPTSVYREGASFGRQAKLKGLDGGGQDPGSYVWNWASPESTYYYSDKNDKLHIVAYNAQNQMLYDALYSGNGVKSVVKIKMPLPLWGGFYAAPDGYFYVVTGQKNLEESDTKPVVKIGKYSRSWKLAGSLDVPGGVSNMFQGIYIPFDAASLRMTEIGKTLVIHTGREMFASDDGVHHQSNITFMVDTEKMKLIESSMPYSSHSFNQFVVNDGSSVYFLDHGDAFERALVISKYNYYGNGTLSGEWGVQAFPFMGDIGNNYTGCEVTGFALEGDTLITIGKSVPHQFPVDGVTGWDSSLNQNVFMLLTDKHTGGTRFFWMTNYTPNGKRVILTEPKLVKVAKNRYAVLFSEETDGKSVLHYGLIDANGNLFLEKSYTGVTIQTNSQPFYMNGRIYWASGKYENGSYGDKNAYLYRIPVVTTPLTRITLDKEKLSLEDGKKAQLFVNFEPKNCDDVKEVVWKSSNASAASVDSKGVVTANGYGSAVITAQCGNLYASCKVSVTIPVSDKPLSRPSLKTSQSGADKIRLRWSSVKGAKGYQVYYRTSSGSSYKKLATVKGRTDYETAASPGKTYSYKVRAYGTDSKGKYKYSEFSSVVSRKAEVPAPKTIRCALGEKGMNLTWSKVEGATGYGIYRNGKLAKKVKPTQLFWEDEKAYDLDNNRYYVYDYYVKAFKNVKGKNIYSKPSKTVNLFNGK